jgi:hypothetical protein
MAGYGGFTCAGWCSDDDEFAAHAGEGSQIIRRGKEKVEGRD